MPTYKIHDDGFDEWISLAQGPRGIPGPQGPASERFDVRAFGAVGDGVANDTAAIQAAIDAAGAAKGGEVYFPAGMYSYTNLTVTANGVYLVGSGRGSTSGGSLVGGVFLARRSGSTGNGVTLATGNTGIRHMNISGGGVGSSVVVGHPRTHIHDCQISNGGGSGNACLLIEQIGDTGALTTLVSDCIIKDGQGHGVVVRDGSDCKFVNVMSFTNAGDGFRVEPAGGATFFTACHSSGGDVGFFINAPNCQLNGCQSESNASYGVRFNTVSRGGSMVGGSVWSNGSDGVRVNGGAQWTRISGVGFRFNNGAAVRLQEGEDAVVSGNIMFDNKSPKTQTYGVRVDDTFSRAVVTSNICREADHLTEGIVDWGVDTVLANNITT